MTCETGTNCLSKVEVIVDKAVSVIVAVTVPVVNAAIACASATAVLPVRVTFIASVPETVPSVVEALNSATSPLLASVSIIVATV